MCTDLNKELCKSPEKRTVFILIKVKICVKVETSGLCVYGKKQFQIDWVIFHIHQKYEKGVFFYRSVINKI